MSAGGGAGIWRRRWLPCDSDGAMNPIVLLVCGGGACAGAVAAGLVLVPDGSDAAIALAVLGVAFHGAMIALDLRSTAVFGLVAVLRDERSVLYRRLVRRVGLAGGGACMWGLDYALAWCMLPVVVAGVWPDARMSGLFLMVLGAIHMAGWLSNRHMARGRYRAA